MSLNKPILDDRSYQQIRDELVQRIPVYAPEWTDHNVSDPGIALIELFSYLTENILFRFNQIPDATKMEFLRLLQIPLRSAQPSKAMLTFTTKENSGVLISPSVSGNERAPQATAGEIKFSLKNEVNVLPLSGVAAIKETASAPDDDTEEALFYEKAQQALDISESGKSAPYTVKTIWQEEPDVSRDFESSVDKVLWLAVMVEKAKEKDIIKSALLKANNDSPLILNVGFVPEVRLDPENPLDPNLLDRCFRCPGEGSSSAVNGVNWEISYANDEAEELADDKLYKALQVVGDTTNGLLNEGIVRVQLPSNLDEMGELITDDPNLAGTGSLPPQLDDDLNERVIFWLRAYRLDGDSPGKVRYVGLNCVQVEQTISARPEFIGTGTGQANQVYTLNHRQVISQSVELEVEEPQGWTAWQEVDNLIASGESDRHYQLDLEGGLIKFGTGLRGQVPQIGQRIRVRQYKYGGGSVGNVAAEAISKITPNKAVKLSNPLPAFGGADSENLADALERIPGELRRRERAVTRGDFKELALQTPGANIGRAEVMPLRHPSFPKQDSPGNVSIIVWPTEDPDNPGAPLPNKNQINAVCQWLDARRLVTTELHVLPPKYRPIALAVGIQVKDGFGIDAVRHWVELVLRQYLAPLPPFGPEGQGWPLGRRIYLPELEAAVLQVEGVEFIVLDGMKIADLSVVSTAETTAIELDENEVPELVGITVESGEITVNPGEVLTPASPDLPPIPIPVLREEC